MFFFFSTITDCIYIDFLLCAGCLVSKKSVTTDIKKQLSNNTSGVAAESVAAAVRNLQKDAVVTALWRIRDFSEFSQGTSPLEALHSTLAAQKPTKATKQTWESLDMALSLIYLEYNYRYNIVVVLFLYCLFSVYNSLIKAAAVCFWV